MEDKELEEITKEEHLADEVMNMFKYQIFGTITKEGQELVYQVIHNLQQENTQLQQEKEELQDIIDTALAHCNESINNYLSDKEWEDMDDKRIHYASVRDYYIKPVQSILDKKGDNNMNEQIFSETIEEFIKQYSFVDTDKVYTNGIELIPVFRIMQWLENQKVIDKKEE